MSATEWKNVAYPRWIRLLDYFFLMRPVLFLPGWITLLAGYLIARGQNAVFRDILNGQWEIESGNVLLFGGLVVFSAAMGGSFIFNQIYDVDSDRKNNKLFLLGDGIISLTAGTIFGSVLLLISFIGAGLIHLRFAIIIAVFNGVTAYMYNAWPFHLKSRPIGGLVANMAMGVLAFWAGWSLVSELTMQAVAFAIPYLLFNTGLYFFTTLPDVEGDAATGKITFPVRFGQQFTLKLGLGLLLLSGIWAWWLREEMLMLIVFFTVPVMLQVIRRFSVRQAIVLLKWAILVFAVVIGTRFPLLFAIGGALYGISRYYYRIRFNMEYPTMKPQ